MCGAWRGAGEDKSSGTAGCEPVAQSEVRGTVDHLLVRCFRSSGAFKDRCVDKFRWIGRLLW